MQSYLEGETERERDGIHLLTSHMRRRAGGKKESDVLMSSKAIGKLDEIQGGP